MKRPSSCLRPKVEPASFSSWSPAISAIVDTLNIANIKEESVKDMLLTQAPICLTKRKEDRHPFEESMVEMIGSTLDSVRQEIKDQIASIDTKLASADSEREQARLDVSDAELAHQKAQQLYDDKQKEFEKAQEAVNDAEEALVKAKRTEKVACIVLEAYQPRLDAVKEKRLHLAEELKHFISGPLEVFAKLKDRIHTNNMACSEKMTAVKKAKLKLQDAD